MNNPYLLDLPAVVSFSGGRTSGFMLHHILEALGGQPDNLKVCFQNTGLEHPATYDFIQEVSERWSLDIVWTEYCVNDEGDHAYRIVNYETASRNGEPFTALIQKRQMLPTPVARICTVMLKMRTLDRYLKTLPEFVDGYTNAVGLRYDEPRRATRLKPDNPREEMSVPMYRAEHTNDDVLAFWKAQDFDLQLPWGNNLWGNCEGCFLKSKGKIELIAEENPSALEWWKNAEESMVGVMDTPRFRLDRPSYANILKQVREQGRLFGDEDDDTIPCFCTD